LDDVGGSYDSGMARETFDVLECPNCTRDFVLSREQVLSICGREQEEAARLRLVIADAARFIRARNTEGVEFPYDSRPLRRLYEIADGLK
jgi:hypothetical protein